jgi:hypothetical protein
MQLFHFSSLFTTCFGPNWPPSSVFHFAKTVKLIISLLPKKNAVFWVVAQCGSCVKRYFGGTYCLHFQYRIIRELVQFAANCSCWFRPVPHIVQSIYKYAPDTWCLGLFVNDASIYATDRRQGYVFRKMQRGLSGIETWCEGWKIKINENKTQVTYFSHGLRPLTVILY